jgi:hypothetical protein
LAEQRRLIEKMTEKGQSAAKAERLLRNFDETLEIAREGSDP